MMMYKARKNFNGHYYFMPKPNLVQVPYILDILWQDKDWFKDILVVNGDLEGDILGVRVRNIPYPNLCLNNDLENIGVC